MPTRQIPRALTDRAEEVARTFGVSASLHPGDYMFWFFHDEPHVVDKLDVPAMYFASGREVAMLLRDLLADQPLKTWLTEWADPAAPLSVLEFASGYGRASRHFRTVLPDVDLVACDIHDEAVEFLRTMDIASCPSRAVPEDFDPGRQFDAIFVLSFFTHMPRATWTRWLRALSEALAPDGVLIFTAHGEASRRAMGVETLDPDGFFFAPWSEQKDLPLSDYGGTITTFDFVLSQMKVCGLELMAYKQTGIAHHDVYVARRSARPEASEPHVAGSVLSRWMGSLRISNASRLRS